MPRSTHSFSPARTAARCRGRPRRRRPRCAPRLAASIAPGPPPVITAKPSPHSLRGDLPGRFVHRVVGLGARRAEDADGRAELGQRAEALDELRLDAQHPPRVGVHPVGRTAGVEQPLVGRAGRDLGRPSGARAPCGGRAWAARGSVMSVNHLSSRSRTRWRCSTGTCSSPCGRDRVAGAEVDGRDAQERELRDVGPAELRMASPPTASTKAAAAGCDSPGSAPGAESVTVRSKPSNTSCRCWCACSSLRSGANR